MIRVHSPGMLSRMLVTLVAITLSLPLPAASFAGVDVPPPLPAQPVEEMHWGVKVTDPYRFLEDTGTPAVQRWMRAQADATTAILHKLPGRAALLERLEAIDAHVPAVIGAVRRDARGRLFYLKRNTGENQLKLYRRDRPGATEVLLVDPEAISRAAGTPHAIGSFEPSPDGRHVAYTISASGSEIGTLHVIDSEHGREAMPPIDRVRGGGVAWLDDGSGFFHLRLAPDYATRARAERYLDHRSYFRSLAEPLVERAVFGSGVHPTVALARGDTGYIAMVPGHNRVLAIVAHGVAREISLYQAPLDQAIAGKDAWTKVLDRSAGVHEIAVGPAHLYLRTAKDAPRFKVERLPLDALDAAKQAETVVPESGQVITSLGAAREGLYLTRRDGVVKRLLRLSHANDPALTRIALPVEGNVRIADADPRLSGALLALGGWTRATRHYAVGAGDAIDDLQLAPVGPFDAPTDIEAREVQVKSHDGVHVPVSILMRKGTRLDGTHPLLLYGYGAYGNVEEPGLSPRTLAWIERGGLYAIAHVRGGGVHGDAWRKAGFKATKPNTWKDGIAVAQWLIDQGYTSRERLSILGGSAGGIFVGRAITERPDLFSAAVIAVGNVDSIRSETRSNGAANIPEYGTVTKEDEFHALLAMSPYANVKPDVPYPAVLFEHGVNDSRVDVWMALKLASRLAAATNSGAPVLLRLDYEGGHGAGSTRDQVQQLLADRWSFLLWQAGDPAFQPPER